jgi:sn1-specific diacylglycerol lipase
MLFRGGDLTPSDVLAGTILLSEKEQDQFNREARTHRQKSRLNAQPASEEVLPNWMNINEACYFVKYAVATYSWPYYIYMHNLRGLSHLCCNTSMCFCFPTVASVSASSREANSGFDTILAIEANTNADRHMKAFKFLAKIEENDMIYANFNNELFLVPFCVLVDHFKKSVVITIRGTLSMRDVITDVTAECTYFDVDGLTNQQCHVGIMNTADNILNKIRSNGLLEKAFRSNPVGHIFFY